MLDRRFDRFPSMKRRALELEGGRVTMPAIDPDLCTVIRCAYCGRFALDPPEAPPATDREGWAFLAGQHWPECPWVQTRAWVAPDGTETERGNPRAKHLEGSCLRDLLRGGESQ